MLKLFEINLKSYVLQMVNLILGNQDQNNIYLINFIPIEILLTILNKKIDLLIS